MPLRAEIDRDLCASTGECVLRAPQAFALDDDDGLAVVLPGVAELDEEELVQVGRECPANAIRVIDADGSVLLETG